MPDERKGFWDKIVSSQVILTTLVALVIGLLTVLLTRQSNTITRENNDAANMAKYVEYYGQPEKRRLSIDLIKKLSSSCDREGLRQRVVWDTLDRNINKSRPFSFDDENQDWHLLGDVLLDMKRDDKCHYDFDHWWSEYVKRHTVEIRWKMHDKELVRLYEWLESIYIPPSDIRQSPTTVATQNGLAERLVRLMSSWDPSGWVVTVIVGLYCSSIVMLILFAVHRCVLTMRFWWYGLPPTPRHKADPSQQILVQLPIYNEQNVVRRLIRAVSKLDWPINNLQIQVLDDSTDETSAIIDKEVKELESRGFRIQHLQRKNRENYKAGALAFGLKHSEADLICIFDADFIPPKAFLRKIVGHFSDPSVGMVQARWTHVNAQHSWLTRLQATLLDGHFVVEQVGRYRSGCFFNFNGTAAVWRRQAIEKAGGWGTGTLTEDLELSYRAQLNVKDCKFVYRPDIEAPAELPENMLGFKAQQRRWSCGSLQTARKLMGQIWKAEIPLQCKIEATAHLLNNSAYALVFMAGLLSAPVHIYGAREPQALVSYLEVGLLIVGGIAIILFLFAARCYTGRRRVGGRVSVKVLREGHSKGVRVSLGGLSRLYSHLRKTLTDTLVVLLYVILIMLLGMGMSVNNGLAAIRGTISQGGDFARTPKYGVDRERHWWRRPYGAQQVLGQLFVEIAFFLYICYSVLVTWQYLRLSSFAYWYWLVFPVLFAVGLGYVLFMTLKHRFLQKRM